MTVRTLRGAVCGLAAVALIATVWVDHSSGPNPEAPPSVAPKNDLQQMSATDRVSRESLRKMAIPADATAREPLTPQGAPFGQVQDLSSQLSESEREMLTAANRRVEALHQEVERSNARTIRTRDTETSSTIVVLITPPTPEQLRELARGADAELEEFRRKGRIESAAIQSFHRISKSFTDFRDNKYKVLIPVVSEDRQRAPAFVRGFSNSDALANPFEEGSEDFVPNYLSKVSIELPMTEAATTSHWRGEDPLYQRYGYLFEISGSE